MIDILIITPRLQDWEGKQRTQDGFLRRSPAHPTLPLLPPGNNSDDDEDDDDDDNDPQGAPMLVPNHPEFYAVYHGGGQPAVVDASTYYYEPKGMMSQSGQCYIIHRSALFYLYIN